MAAYSPRLHRFIAWMMFGASAVVILGIAFVDHPLR